MRICSCRGKRPNDPSILYCGRGTRNGWKASPLGNPFKGTDPDWVEKYRGWLQARIEAKDPAVLAALARITEDSTLGCWCIEADDAEFIMPDAEIWCHCEIIVQEWLWMQSQAETPPPVVR